MKPLEQALKEYLRIRRGLGFQLRETEGLLRNFVAFLQAKGAPYITSEWALRWATQPAKAQPSTLAERLGIVRRFALWYSATEPRTEIPPAGLLPHSLLPQASAHLQRRREGVVALGVGAFQSSPKGLRALTYMTLFGLLIATGMRVNEALGLDRPDVDLKLGILPAGEVREIALCARSPFHCEGSEKVRRSPRSPFPHTTPSCIFHLREM